MEWDIVVDSVKIKLAFTNRIPYATNLLNYSIVVTIFFIPTLTAYICSKSDWSHISSQIFRFAVFYPTQQGIQHTPDFSPLCFLFSKMKDNISSKQPLLTFHHYMSSIVVVADWQAQNKKWAGVGFSGIIGSARKMCCCLRQNLKITFFIFGYIGWNPICLLISSICFTTSPP